MIINKASSQAQIQSMLPATAIAANTMHIALFKGSKPDLGLALNGVPGASGSVASWATIVAALGLTSANFLGNMILPAFTPRVEVGTRTVTIPMTTLVANFTAPTTDVPTFFVLRQLSVASTDSTFAGFSAAGNALLTMIGTVSNVDEGGELQFIGPSLVQGQVYRFFDLAIQL